MSKEFIGRGWAFPVSTDQTGGIALVSDNEEVEQAIRINPFDPDPHCALAKIYGDAHDARAAVEEHACKELN